jgi:capsular polysaccharide biosynthesis protein
MPDITLSYRAAVFFRRYPAIHRPLKWLRRRAFPVCANRLTDVVRFCTASLSRFGPPAGTFAIRDRIQRGELEGEIILETQGAPVLPERSIVIRSNLNQHGEQPWPILWSRHKEARLIGSTLALVDEQKRMAVESAYRHYYPDNPGYYQLLLPRSVRLPGCWTSLVSRWNPNTGVAPFSHWIMDALPRLALLKKFPADTGILVPSALAGYQKESLKLLGLLDRVRYSPEQHLIVEDYYFSSPTTMIACYNPYGVNWLRSAFLPLADKTYHGPKRFIIQRKGKTRGIKNEPEVNDFFRGLGWEIIDTEKLTFAQEIQLFAHAEAFAGVLGSGFTNAIWSSPGCQVITFVADSWMDGWVEWICEVNKLGYHWETFPADHETMVTVSLDAIRKLLREAGLAAG